MAKRSSSTVKDSVASALSKYERIDHWAGIAKGDPVAIPSVQGRSVNFTFLAHVTNLESGEVWIEVVGGSRGDRQIRSFAPDQVYPKTAKAAPSLFDAPQLDLF